MTAPRVSRFSGESGYLMVALLVAMTVMAIMMTAAMPAWHTLARREKEAELVFRGEQYARALMLYQRRFANQPAPSVDALVTGRYLRKKYKDPITNDDFQLLGGGATMPGQVSGPAFQQGLQQAQAALKQAAGRAGAASATRGGPVPAAAQGGRGGVALGGGVTGGIVGVTSKSEEKSLRLYNGRDTYNQWIFMPVAQASRAGGVGPGGAGRGSDGRGGPEGVRGRGAQPQGDGGRGRGAQPPGDAGRGARGRGF